MSQAVGIDLGTTYSAVAVVRATGKSEILNNQDGDPITPSVVLFQNWGDGDEPLVGVQAKNLAAATPMDVAQFVKRHMGDPDWRFDSSSGNSYTAEEVTAIILKRLKQDAELALGEPITDVVITVPAYFDDARRTATKQAGKIAGLNVLRVLNEPTAAALSYGLGANRGGTVLVYDLGGGTFDVTLLRIDGAEFDVIATDGDRNLGGFDFDNALIQFIAEKMQAQGAQNVLESVEATAALREKAEQAKRSLTSVNNTNVHLSFEGRQYRVPVTRDDFVEVTRSLVNRTKEIVEDVLTEARTTWDQVDRILLVGGSTRMPMIRDMVQQLSGKTAELDVNPDEAVALGAAIQAAVELTATSGPAGASGLKAGLLGGATLKISDVTSQTLGVITVTGPNNEVEVNSVVIPRNAKVPSKHSLDLQTIYENQTRLHVQVTQGDDPDPKFVTVVGESELKMPPYPVGSPLRVTYHYDVDQTIFVEVDDLVANRSLGTFEIDRRANLKDEEVQKAAVRIAKVEVS